MARYLEPLHPGGTLTYFAYRGTRQARAQLSSRAQARRHHAVEEVMAAYRLRYATGRWSVCANLPPARVWQPRRPYRDAPGARAGLYDVTGARR
uniref:hypothetical protein n=1 Tax=Streptomyces sp. DG1A-41 TaxID=3125779 RepID=UPI0040401FCA